MPALLKFMVEVILIGCFVLLVVTGIWFVFFRRPQKNKRPGFDNNPLPQWIFHKESLRFLAVNQAAVQLYGYTEAEFRHMTIKDIRPAWDINRLETHINSHALYGRNSGVWKHLTKNGDVILVRLEADDIFYKGGTQRLITAENITHTLKAH